MSKMLRLQRHSQRDISIANNFSVDQPGLSNNLTLLVRPDKQHNATIIDLTPCVRSQIDKARGFLEAGERLQPMAFVGNMTTKEVIPVMIQTGSEQGKDQSARTIQSAALALEADFVFAIMEAWTLQPDKMRQMNAILDKYGSVSASPYAIDTCALTLETRHGLWAAQPQIKPKGISKKLRLNSLVISGSLKSLRLIAGKPRSRIRHPTHHQ